MDIQKYGSLNSLASEQLKFKDITMLKQLRDCVLSVASKRNKLAISEMFTTELKFTGNCLIRWFNAKIKSENMQLSNDMRRKHEVENPIIWHTDRCCNCTFPIEINPEMSDATKDNMSYSDFVIFKEHKLLRNIFSEEELSKRTALKKIHTYHKNFSRSSKVAIYLQNNLNTIQEFSDCLYDELIKFCNEFYKDCVDFMEIKERISAVQIKNKQGSKISKFSLQLYAFVYQRIMDFPRGRFDYETLTTNSLFKSIHKIINVKVASLTYYGENYRLCTRCLQFKS